MFRPIVRIIRNIWTDQYGHSVEIVGLTVIVSLLHIGSILTDLRRIHAGFDVTGGDLREIQPTAG
jgi:hypothetical protein